MQRIVIFEDSDNEEVNKELEENKKDEPKFSTIVSDDEINSNESFKSKKKKVKQVLNFSGLLINFKKFI